MKLQGFKIIYEEGSNLEVWHIESTDIPLNLAIHKKIVGVNHCRTPFRENYDGEFPFFFYSGPLGIKLNKGIKRVRQGLVVSARLSLLVDFLIEKYYPVSSSELDSLIRRCRERKLSKEIIRMKVEDLLGPKSKGIGKILNSSSASSMESSVHFIGNEDLDSLPKIELPSGSFRFPTAEKRLIVSNYYLEDFCGYQIPRRKFAIIKELKEEVLYWDGEKLIKLKNIKELPFSFMNSVEKSGAMEDEMPGQEQILSDMRPSFILRIPPSKQIKGVKEKTLDSLNSALRVPSFLFNSVTTISLPSEVCKAPKRNLIDDPSEALYVLKRTSSNMVYVPSGSPIDIDPAKLSHSEEFWVGASVGG